MWILNNEDPDQLASDEGSTLLSKGSTHVYNLKKVICTVKLLYQIQQRKQFMKLSYIINTCTPRKVRLGKKAALTGTRPGSSWAFSSARIPKISNSISLNLFVQMGSSFWFDTINLGWLILYIEGSQVKISKLQGPHRNSKTQFHDFSMIFHDCTTSNLPF